MKQGAESFLPRIRCVFYAIFDHEQGPKVVHQVPEGSIISPVVPVISPEQSTLRANGKERRTATHTPGLFEFDSVSQYVIPKDQLCGSLVRVNTPSHRILGYPVKLEGARYKGHRNSFRYNVCLVFDRVADVSCYEPMVRKIGRVLLACEQESSLLSNPKFSHKIPPILEQLFEDLNSYSETSIPIDDFNSIELQIFPFYPNPPKVEVWQVPVALVNLEKRKDPNWDLAMAKITSHINGMNHTQRIADLADVSPELTRHCLEHLLFYQCIMMIDIFQYSNMYTLKSNFQWLAEEISVQEECALYVTRPGHTPPPLADLLYLYSHLKPGKTLHTWMEEHDIESRGIDVQRFVTFGVIKGFLRRVHRWPVLLP
ncbi:nitrogen permease regulator 2, partial [Clavulina sp. PMI_390]